MSEFVHKEIQKAIYTLLSNTSAITDKVTGIYEEVPGLTNFPYIVFGRMQSRDNSTKTNMMLQSLVELHVYGRSGREEILDIMDFVFDTLQSQDLILDQYHMVAMRFDYNEISQLNDGLTQHGLLRYRAYTELLTV